MQEEIYAPVQMCERRPGCPCEFVERDGEEYCIHCGRAGRRALSTLQQKVYQHSDESKLHADEGLPLGLCGTTLSHDAYTSNTGNLGAGFKARDRTKEGIGKLNAKYAAMQKYRHEIEDYCVLIGLGRMCLNECLAIFDRFAMSSKNSIPQSRFTLVYLGVLFHGCKRGNTPFTIKNLAKVTGKSEVLVRKGVRLVEKKCEMYRDKVIVESSNLIENYCKQLGMDKTFMNVFVPNAKFVDDKIRHFLEGKRPTTVAATDIFLTLKWFYTEVTKWDISVIASSLGIRDTTLSDSINDVFRKLDEAGFTPEDVVKEAKKLCR